MRAWYLTTFLMVFLSWHIKTMRCWVHTPGLMTATVVAFCVRWVHISVDDTADTATNVHLMYVKCLELLQRRATKFIVNDTSMDYRNRLIHLKLLPLMMELEIADIIFFIKSVRYPSDHFNIFDFVQFSAHHTRSSSNCKLKHTVSRNYNEKIFYFNRIPQLWNSLPPLDISLPLSSFKSKLHNYFWDNFISYFNPNDECSYHYLCLCYKCSSLPVNMHFSSNSF
jgi:hypothetical protein